MGWFGQKKNSVTPIMGADPGGEAGQQPVHLKREVGMWGGIALIVGSTIGSGIFISPGGVLGQSGSVGAGLLVWVGGGLIAFLGTLAYLELGMAIPENGGEYIYIYHGIHRSAAFLYCWMNFFVLKPATFAILGSVFGEYVVQPFWGNATIESYETPEDAEHARWSIQVTVAVIAMAVMTLLNCCSTKWTSRLVSFLTIVKLIPLVAILIVGIYNLAVGQTEHLATGFETIPGSEISFGSIPLAFYAALWSYDGWNQLNFVTEEIEKPMINLPRAIYVSLPFITFIYMLVNISYLTVLSPTAIITSKAVANDWAAKMLAGSTNPTLNWLSDYMPYFMAFSVALSIFGAASGSLLASGRANFAAARANQLPELIAMVHVKRSTPIPSLLCTFTFGVLYILLSDVGSLLNFFSFAVWTFYGLAFLAVVVLRIRKPQLERPFRIFIVIPAVLFLIALYLVVAPLVDDFQIEFVYALIFILAGLIFYFPFVHFEKRIPGIDGFYRKVGRTCNLSLSEKDLQ